MSEDKLLESPLHRHIKSQCDHYRTEYEQLKRQLESAQRQIQELEGSRRLAKDQMEEEERERRKILENELKSLEVESTKAKLEKKDAVEAHQIIAQQLKRSEELVKESGLLCNTLKVCCYRERLGFQELSIPNF
jgi:chromosome segregation ATPase